MSYYNNFQEISKMDEPQCDENSPELDGVILADAKMPGNIILQDIKKDKKENTDKSSCCLCGLGAVCLIISAFIIVFNLFLWIYFDMKDREQH